jgi:hypothetical protein
MVTQSQLNRFRQHWRYHGHVSYQEATDTWSVTGDVELKGSLDSTLPHKFDVVTGVFDVALSGLTSLEGAPTECKVCVIHSNPQLNSLKHVPKCKVLKMSSCVDLASLEHMPEHLDFLKISWYPWLSMLRCLNAKKVEFSPSAYSHILESVFNDVRWAGKGKMGMLNCALELKKQGAALTTQDGVNPFIMNAKW